jgi:hypothetical protein
MSKVYIVPLRQHRICWNVILYAKTLEIIKQLYDTFICFQLHITIMAFINKKTPQPKLAISSDYS